MSEAARSRLPAQLLAAYVDGEVTPSEAAAVEAAAADCAVTRRQLAELRRMREALSSPLPELEATDLVASLRTKIDAGVLPERPPPRRWRTALLSCVAAAAAILLLVRIDGRAGFGSGPETAGEFHAKSASSDASTSARWAGVRAHYVAPGQAPQRLLDALPEEAGLLVSYTNLGPRPYEYLMVFVVDSRGEVRWCYPAYERSGTNPSSIRIQKREADMPLGELIKLDLARGPATLHALFSNRPLRVLEVEAWVAQQRSGPTPLPWREEQALHQVSGFEVRP